MTLAFIGCVTTGVVTMQRWPTLSEHQAPQGPLHGLRSQSSKKVVLPRSPFPDEES